MPITTVVLNKVGIAEIDVIDFPAIDVSAFALADTSISADGNTRESVYNLVSGSDEYPMSLRVGVYKNPKANEGVGSTNVSVKITNFVEKSDVDDVIWTKAATWTLAKSTPGGSAFPDPAGDKAMLGTLFSCLVAIEAGLITDTHIDDLKFGITNRLLSHAQSGHA